MVFISLPILGVLEVEGLEDTRSVPSKLMSDIEYSVILEVEGLLFCIRINVVFISLPILGCQSVGSGRLVTLY